MKKNWAIIFILLLIGMLFSCELSPESIAIIGDNSFQEEPVEAQPLGQNQTSQENDKDQSGTPLNEKGYYTRVDDVSVYIHTYGHLPDNYLTKKEAVALGWESNKGNLWEVTSKMSIGGDYFGNREGRLPQSAGRKWYECDVNYDGGYRGAERILYSSDGLIYYTNDHYETFEALYE